MPRLWLDATVDDAEQPGPSWRPPVPPIPEARESLDTSHSSPLFAASSSADEPHTPTISQRRRRAMPPPLKTANARPRHRAAARRSHASPDVISSLVDSLATISAPANDHFDAIPSLGDAQSRAQSRPLRRMGSDDTGLTDGQAAFAGFSQTHPAAIDDAAIPPVIKTAPPPSGFSPLTAPPKPQKAPKESPVRGYFRSGSRASLHSHRSSDLANPSLDSVVLNRPASPTDAAAPPDISRTNRHKSLSQSGSHERLREEASESQRPVINLGEDPAYLGAQKSRQKAHVPRKKHAFDPPRPGPIAEESQGEEVFGAKASGKQRAKNLGIPGEASPSVPQRQSSLLQTDGSSYASSSKASSRRKSGKSESASHRSTTLQSDVHKPTRGNMISRIRKKESLKFEDVQDIDSEVVKRIKELKARKELRDREAQEQPLPVQPPERTTSVARHARSASDPQTSAPADDALHVSGTPAYHALSTAGHKRSSSTELPGTVGQPTVVDAPRPGQPRPATPLTPPSGADALPINYNYVMQKLEKAQAKAGSNHASGANGDAAGGRVRPKSFSLTGRRKHTRTATSGSSGADSHAGTPRTSTQDGREDDQDSLDFVLSRTTPKKNRWSNPSPGKEARGTKSSRGNKEKVDSFAVKAVSNSKSGTDGRPSTSHSVDSVADDVKAFIYAPRLTQKIRHPQTGRTIAFSEVGDPNGYAVFCCVGMGLTRYITAFYDELATTLKLRLITPDRPGVGESQSDPNGTPLSWPDDVVAICQALHIKSFSVMAHSAGAIYALATALRIPQHIRGKVHLLAPWIPPSQIEAAGIHTDSPPTTQLPKAQRLLRVLPTPFLRVANSSFMTATSASLSPKTAGTPTPQSRRKRTPAKPTDSQPATGRNSTSTNPPTQHHRRESMMLMDQTMPNGSALTVGHPANPASPSSPSEPHLVAASTLAEEERRREYDAHLTLRIWDLATTNANPAVDLLVCLERTRSIGFRYVDVNRAVVIHHGSKDTRVPLDNVKWLGNTMRKCQVRVLEGEGHGLMASAGVMGSVLTEMAAEWEEWSRYTAEKKVEKSVPRKDVGFTSALGAATILAS